MKTICGKMKKAIIIGVSAVMLFAALPTDANTDQLPNSWFITGSFSFDDDSENGGITVITDKEEVPF